MSKKKKPKFDKLNVGCGFDYRQNFINIDCNTHLPKVDIVVDIKPGILLKYFEQESFDYILVQSILEHFFHWEACLLLKDFYMMLTKNGKLNLTIPNVENIIGDNKGISEKLLWLYGGQDILPNEKLDIHRQNFPQYYCHKFGWTFDSIKTELTFAGFVDIKFIDYSWNMNIISKKEG